MLRAELDNPNPSPIPSLWFPGKTVVYPVPTTARAQEIAKSREELIGLLRDAPESEYELSLTDLVEKQSAAAESSLAEHGRETSGAVVRWKGGKHTKTKSASSDGRGVLLNVFVPVSMTRSLTRSSSSVSTRSHLDCNRREEALPGCLSVIWERSKGRSSRHRGASTDH